MAADIIAGFLAIGIELNILCVIIDFTHQTLSHIKQGQYRLLLYIQTYIC